MEGFGFEERNKRDTIIYFKKKMHTAYFLKE